MAFKLPNNVQETSTTTGTASCVCGGVIDGAYSFASQLANGDRTILTMTDGTDTECSYATYNSGANSFTRDSVIWSTQSDAPINWPSGTRNIFAALPGDVLEALLDPAGASFSVPALFTGDVTLGANAASIITPSGETFAASQVIDLSRSSLKTITVSASFTAAGGLITSNRIAGAMALVRMVGSGGPWNFPTSGAGFFADWKWIGARPTTLAAGKVGMLSLLCFGTAESDVVASWSFEA